MYPLIRPLLFRLDAEDAHNLALRALGLAGDFAPTQRLLTATYRVEDPCLHVQAFGLTFQNPIGLAAGYDKNAVAVRGLASLGFGHVEIGTVTLKPQAGNPRPRVHRVREAQGIINSMGFPNVGVDALPSPLQPTLQERGTLRLGINLGKGKDTPLERAAEDYCALLYRMYMQADYVTINVSSPNTLGLRQLQARAAMENLLKAVASARNELIPRVPLLVKIAPDLSESELDDVLAAVSACGINGVIAVNTTVSRDGIPPRYADLTGGLSGAPLRARATAVVRYLARATGGKLPLIGVGGVVSAADALEKIHAGAWLVQVYTGLIYAGPRLPRQINEGLVRACRQYGIKNIEELRGTAL